MKIRLKQSGDVRDCSSDIGDMMVAAGFADPLTEQEANNYTIRSSGNPYHSFTWHARDGEYVDGKQYAPALVWRCDTCQALTYAHPMDKPANQTVFHFQKQTCPDELYQAYLKLFDAWKVKDNRRHLKGLYDRVIDGAWQRTKDGLDDRSRPPRNGEATAI